MRKGNLKKKKPFDERDTVYIINGGIKDRPTTLRPPPPVGQGLPIHNKE